MTPTPADQRKSGNPATQAEINLTVKQQREQKRQAKLADNDARIRELPVVKAALAAFPDARLVEDDDNRHRSNP